MFLVLICLFKPHFLKPGPKKNTVVDFWRMIWQEEVTSIVMLTNLKEGDKVIITVKKEVFSKDGKSQSVKVVIHT